MVNKEKLKRAIAKDFCDLYKKEFTTDYFNQRIMRAIEINIMTFNHTIKFIEKLNK